MDQQHMMNASAAAKRRRVTTTMQQPSSSSTTNSSSGSGLGGISSLTPADEYHHHVSRGRGHQLHSHHSHEASGGESADGSRPGTPLCDERPEVLPTEPRRLPPPRERVRERTRDVMWLPLPKFGVLFFQQQQSRSSGGGGAGNSYLQQQLGGGSTGGLGCIGAASSSACSLNNSSLNASQGMGSCSGSTFLPSPSSRYWRSSSHHQNQQNNHQQQSQQLHGSSSSNTCLMASPARPRSLSSNSSDSDVPGQNAGGSPSLDERLRNFEENYERWSGGSSREHISGHTPSSATPSWQLSMHMNLSTGLNSHQTSSASGNSNSSSGTVSSSASNSRHKFLDIDELQPSDIVKSVLAKKSVFDDDFQRLNKNQWYDPSSSDFALGSSSNIVTGSSLVANVSRHPGGPCSGNTSPALPNLAATKATPIIGNCSGGLGNSTGSKSAGLLQRLSSLSPMNSPQASMSPYNSPSPSPSVGGVTACLGQLTKPAAPGTASAGLSGGTAASSSSPAANSGPTKGLQYPFPSHPPLPNTAAPPPAVQPAPPPLPEMGKQSRLTGQSSGNNLTKSLSVPDGPQSSPARVQLQKSASVPGSTNVGAPSSLSLDSTTASVETSASISSSTSNGNSSLTSAAIHVQKPQQSTFVEEEHTKKSGTSTSQSSSSSSKKISSTHDKLHSKHNNRSESDKKIKKSDKNASSSDKRKNSSTSQSSKSATPRIEDDSSEADDTADKAEKNQRHEKEKKERQEKREKDLRKQVEREEKDRKAQQEEREKEDRKAKEEEKEREREKKAQEDREKKEREERELREKEQRDKEQKEKEIREKDLREKEQRERDNREKELRDKDLREKEMREKEQREKELHREKDQREREHREKEQSRRAMDVEQEGRGGRMRELSSYQKSKMDIAGEASSLTAIDCQHNKENAMDTIAQGTPGASPSTPSDNTPKERSRKLSRNSPVRLHKRRLSSQESNHSAGGGGSCGGSSHQIHHEDYVKRIRMENSQNISVHSSNQRLNDRRDSKEHKSSSFKEDKNSSSHISRPHGCGGSSASSSKHHHRRDKHHQKGSASSIETNSSIEVVVDPISQTKHNLNTSEEELQSHQPKREKEREHFSSHANSSSSRHKSKRDHHHHREKKRHSVAESTNTDEEHTPQQHNPHRRISAAGSGSAGELSSAATNTSSGKLHHQHHRRSVERKSSRGSDEGHHSSSKSLRAKLMMLSSADSDDTDDASKKHSIFDIPDDCPNVSMYDKVKARSCKNMQRQAEEKKIKAKFSQLKQSRAKKKRSTSYDGDSDTEFEDRQHRNSGSSSFHGRYPGLSSSDDDDDEETHQRRISSDSDAEHGGQDNQGASTLADANRVRQMQQNLRRLCDGDDSSEDEIRRNVMKHSHFGKRNSNSTRIASDSESQSQPAPDLTIKQEHPIAPAQEIKREQLSDEEQKFKSRHDSNSSIEERKLKTEREIKTELGDFYNSSEYTYTGKLKEYSPETRKKHKKSKRRLKSSSTADTSAAQTPLVMTPLTPSIFDVHSSSECKTKFDNFDDLKTECSSIPLEISAGERRKHKERKEKKREKLRNMTEATVPNSPTTNDTSSEKLSKEERHRLKKSKKSKSMDNSCNTKIYNSSGAHPSTSPSLPATPTSAPSTAQTSKRGEDKMEFIFGIISDEEESQFPEQAETNKDIIPSSVSTTGPIVSAALQTYKQEPSTPNSKNEEAHIQLTVHEPEQQQQLERSRLSGGSSSSSHADRERHRREKREKKRREKSQREQQNQIHQKSSKVETKVDDDNSVDMDEAGRALEAQLMSDFDTKPISEEATPSTAATYRSDMTDVFRFSDNEDNNSVDMTKQGVKSEQQEQHKSKDKKKKKKRSKEEKQEKLLQQQRRESLPNVASTSSAPPTPGKLTVNVQAASKHADLQLDAKHISSPPVCKPSPSLPCLIGDDDDDALHTPKAKPTTPSSRGNDGLTPSREKPRLISPIPKTPTIANSSTLSTQSAETPVSSGTVISSSALATTPTSSTAAGVSAAPGLDNSPTSASAQCKKKESFIPGFDGQLDDRISESAVQSISAEFNSTSLLDNIADEPKIPVASPPRATKPLDKLEESKSRVTISQEETESAVSALLGESFGTSSTTDYSLDGMDEMSSVNELETPTLVIAEPDEEAALAAKAIETAGEPASILEEPEMEPEREAEPDPDPEAEIESEPVVEVLDPEELNKAVQSLKHEDMMDIKADTPQSERDLQIDTDTEENPDEADSSGPSLKIDETVQSSSSPEKSISNNSPTPRETANIDIPNVESQPKLSNESTPQPSVITKLPFLDTPKTVPAGLPPSPVKIEPPTISKLQQPLVQPVQTVLPAPHSTGSGISANSVINLDLSNVISSCSNTSTASATASASASISFGSPTASQNAMPQASTPKQGPITPQQAIRTQSLIMQPPTISIPEQTPHFAVPQMVLSPQSHHPQQPGTYMVGIRAPSPHSPLHSPGRGVAQSRLVGQLSPVGRPMVSQPSPQQQVQQTQQQHALITSPQSSNISPLASPTTRVLSSSNSPTTSKVNSYQPRNQQVPQQPSPKSVAEVQTTPQLMTIPLQKMTPIQVPHHPTIISKVVTVQPQQATQSQVASSPPLGSLPPHKNVHLNAHQNQQQPQVIAKMTAHQHQQHMQQFMHQQMIQRQQHMQQQQLHGQSQQITSAPQHQMHQQHQAQQQQQHHNQQHLNQQLHAQQHPTQKQHQAQQQFNQQIQQHQSQQQHQVQQQNQAQQQHLSQQQHQSQQQLNQQHQAQQQQLQQIQKLQQMHGPQQQQKSPQGVGHLGGSTSIFASQQHNSQLPARGVPQQQHPQQLSHSSPCKPNTLVSVNQGVQPPAILTRVGSHSQPNQQQQLPHQQSSSGHPHQKQLSSPGANLPLQTPLNVIQNTPKIIVQQHIVAQNQVPPPQTQGNAIHYPQNQGKDSTPPGHVEPTPAMSAQKTSESVSVIRTPTPTTGLAVISANTVGSLLTEENLIKISQPKQDELIEQDSKEVDSDYWSAKEVNIDSVIKKLDTPLASKDAKRAVEMQAIAPAPIPNPQPGNQSMAQETALPTTSMSVNNSNDHDTEDETETRQLPPAKPPIPTVGRPPGRGGSAKRGRQPRGAKKVGGFPLNSVTAAPPGVDSLVVQPGDNGVQTRLRKPVTAPVTRGRKGRPPRNLLLQQQQLQQQQLDIQRKGMEMVTSATSSTPLPTPIPTSSVLTAAEKKARNQALTQAQEQNQVASQVGTGQDIYEFHEDGGEEPKPKTISSVAPSAEDQRPRLILTINKTQPSIKNISEMEQTIQQQQQQQSEVISNTDPIGGDNSESCNTRKSRRLQEKEDRSTVDDIIEDVVRNTNTPTGTGPHLPKGAQTPPRRSGRNAQAKKTDAVQIINAVGRPRRSKDRKTIGEQTANLIEEVTASNATVAASHLAPPEGAGVESHVPQLDAKEVEPVSVVTPISTPAPVSVAAPVTVPVPAMVPVKPTMPQHPKKKAIAAAEIESYQAINSSIPSGGLPMHQTAAPATQKITGGVADAVSKALVDPVTGVITAGMPQGKEGNLPAATAAAPANSSNEDGQAAPPPQLQHQQQQQHPQQPPQQQANLQINTTLIPSGLPNPITALGKSVQLETSAAALLNKPVSVLVKGNASQVIQQQQPQIVAPAKQPIILQQNPLPTVLHHAQHTTVRPPQPLKAHVLNREKNIQQQLTPTKQAVAQPPQHAPHSGHMLLTDTAGNQQLVQPQIIARHLQQQQHLQVNVPPPTAHSPHSPRIPSQQQQLGPGASISPQQQQPQTVVIKQAASAAQPQILHVVSSKASVVPQPQQQQLPPTSSTGPHLQLAKPNYSYAPTVLTPTLPAVQQQQQQHLYKQNNQQKGAQIQMPPHGIIMPTHPGMLLQQKLPAHLQPQQHQLNPSPPPGKPNPVLHGLQSGQIMPGSVGSPPPVSAAVLKTAQQQVNSVVPVAGKLQNTHIVLYGHS